MVGPLHTLRCLDAVVGGHRHPGAEQRGRSTGFCSRKLLILSRCGSRKLDWPLLERLFKPPAPAASTPHCKRKPPWLPHHMLLGSRLQFLSFICMRTLENFGKMAQGCGYLQPAGRTAFLTGKTSADLCRLLGGQTLRRPSGRNAADAHRHKDRQAVCPPWPTAAAFSIGNPLADAEAHTASVWGVLPGRTSGSGSRCGSATPVLTARR